MSVAFWMLDSNASGMRTIGAAPTLGTRGDHATDFVPRHRAVLHLEPDEVEVLADLAVQLGIEARNRVAGDLSIVEQRFFRAVVERPRRGGIHHGLHLPAPAALVGFLRRQRAADWRAPRRRTTAASGRATSLAAGAGRRRILRGRQEHHGRDGQADRDRKARSRHRDLGLKCGAHYGAFRVSVALDYRFPSESMTRRRLAIALAVPVAVFASLFAQTTKSVWTGVYTTAQATRGTDLYTRVCSECHGDDLEGREKCARARRRIVRAAVGRRDAEETVRAHGGDAARQSSGTSDSRTSTSTSSRFC